MTNWRIILQIKISQIVWQQQAYYQIRKEWREYHVAHMEFKRENFLKYSSQVTKKIEKKISNILIKIITLMHQNYCMSRRDLIDALLINIIWSIASRPSEILAFIFEDFEDKYNKKFVFYYTNKKIQRKKLTS